MRNTLYYGDNLDVLRDFPAEFVDLVYLDPPFNSSRSYNVLFRDESGQEADAQITAFEDTWHWNDHTAHQYHQLLTQSDEAVSRMIEAMRQFIGPNQMMAYLVMMAARLVELHRVLKPSGSLYLHCDPTASHYLKIVLDTIFGVQNYRNHINWQRSDAHSDARLKWASICDHILFYTKSNKFVLNPQWKAYTEKTMREWYLYLEFADGSTRRMTKQEIADQTIPSGARRFNTADMSAPAGGGMAAINKQTGKPNGWYIWKGYNPPERGWRYSPETMQKLEEEGKLLYPKDATGRIMLKRYLDEQEGVLVADMWNDIQPLRAAKAEILGYPTQKPVALLERIVSAGSNPGDLVLDPFCGCGTTIAAAQKLGRTWVGIDITHLSIALQKYRLKAAFGLEPGKDYAVKGEPRDYASALQLANDDRYQFQWWALSLIEARPLGGRGDGREGRKGADKGVDGIISFVDDSSGKAKRVVVQVKSGKVNSSHIRDLVGTVQREKAPLGIYITLEEPTSKMLQEAASAGVYHSPGWNRDYPRIQIVTVQQLLDGATVKLPPSAVTFKQAGKVLKEGDEPQLGFTFEK